MHGPMNVKKRDVTIFVFRYPMGTDTYSHLNTGSISMPDNVALVL